MFVEKKNFLTQHVFGHKKNYLKNAYIISREKSNILIVNIFLRWESPKKGVIENSFFLTFQNQTKK